MLEKIAQEPNLLVDFTAYSSRKALMIRFGEQIRQYGGRQVFLDSAEQVTKSGLASVYPVVCFTDQGQVLKAVPWNAKGRAPLAAVKDYLAGGEMP
jgi:hypothetical protein